MDVATLVAGLYNKLIFLNADTNSGKLKVI